MPILWQWDQGRESYWQFEYLREIAKTLIDIEGANLSQRTTDPLLLLRRNTTLPFATPGGYRIWRQYGRVLGSALLACKIDDKLATTEVCRRLAEVGYSEPFLADEYLVLVTKRFYCPSPAFSGYSPGGARVYPFAALIRYLIALHYKNADATIDIDGVFRYLIGNDVVGNEPLDQLADLPDSGFRPPNADKRRQVREMMPFVGQFSFLLWNGKTLTLDPRVISPHHLSNLATVLMPDRRNQARVDERELLNLGRVSEHTGKTLLATAEAVGITEEDVTFMEGGRVRLTHIRAERNGALRRAFLDRLLRSRSPILCDVCAADLLHRYPWAAILLEVHHLLPLGSTIRVAPSGTSFDDLVAICPNCHRAVHAFYTIFLRQERRQDFMSRAEAVKVYRRAKSQARFP